MGILNRAVKSTRSPPAVSISSSVELPFEMRAAMDAVSATLDARKAIDEAIGRNLAEQSEAEVENNQASAALTEIDVAAALETNPAALRVLEPKIDAARRAKDQAEQKVARIRRLKVALAEKAREIDGRLSGDRTLFQIEAQAYGQQLLAVLGAELREAAKPLVGTLLKLHAAVYGLGVGRGMVGLLEEVNLPSAVWGEPSLIAGPRFTDDGGAPRDMSTAWHDAPEAAALACAMQPYADLRRRLAAHRDYQDPPPRAEAPYVVKSVGHGDQEKWARERAAIAEREAAAEAARPKVKPNSWTGAPGSFG